MVLASRAPVGAATPAADLRRLRRRGRLSMMLVPLGVGGFEFIPPVDRGEVFVQLTYPTGTPLATTPRSAHRQTHFGAAGHRIADGSRRRNAVELRRLDRARIGRPDPRLPETEAPPTDRLLGAASSAGLPARSRRPRESSRFRQPGPVVATLSRSTIWSPRPNDDPDAYAEQVAARAAETPGTLNVNTSAEQLAPQIDVEFDRELTRALDVNIGQAAAAIRAAYRRHARHAVRHLPTGSSTCK